MANDALSKEVCILNVTSCITVVCYALSPVRFELVFGEIFEECQVF